MAERVALMAISIKVVSPNEFDSAAAALIQASVLQAATAVSGRPLNIGTATGGTMEGPWRALSSLRELPFVKILRRARFWLLDEYRGVDKTDPNSYWRFNDELIAKPFGLGMHQFESPCEDNIVQSRGDKLPGFSCYDDALRDAGGLDLQMLGIGTEGHIGFNELGTIFESWTRKVLLAPSTIEANKRFFGGDPSKVPTEAYTMGIQTILGARKIILLATGAHKADAIYSMLEEKDAAKCPAAHLFAARCEVEVLLDTEAASKLSGKTLADFCVAS